MSIPAMFSHMSVEHLLTNINPACQLPTPHISKANHQLGLFWGLPGRVHILLSASSIVEEGAQDATHIAASS